uniref:Uncharacterized protein n=1 Tax=Lepeophtheirus salmonis TaxID=72036 RepID=A0A0K2USN6_LEPSM
MLIASLLALFNLQIICLRALAKFRNSVGV